MEKSVVVRGTCNYFIWAYRFRISGSGASGIPGGIIGALIESGFSKTSSNIYEAGIKKRKYHYWS